MTVPRRGVHGAREGGSWFRHPVALPVAVALLTVALLGGVAGVAVHEARASAQREAQQRVRSNRDAAVRALEHQSVDLKRAVAAWASDPGLIDSLQEPELTVVDGAEDQLTLLARSTDAPAAFVSDAQGRLVAVYPPQPDLVGTDFSFRDWYLGLSVDGGPYVSTAYRTAAAGHPLVVAVAAPVRDGARVLGSVAILWQLDSVRAVSDGARVDDGVALLVTDQRGQPLAGTVTVDKDGQALPAEVSATTEKALAGHTVSAVAEGRLEEAGPVPGLGWTVTASLPVSVALAPARAATRSLTGALGVTFLLVLAVTVLAARFARRRAAEHVAMRVAEDRFRRLFDQALTGQLLVDRAGFVIRVNSTLVEVLGREAIELVGLPLAAFFTDDSDRRRIVDLIEAGDGELQAEMSLNDADGRSLRGLVALSWMRELGDQRVLLAQIEDITARRDAERRLTELSLHDELTGLPNRRLLLERCYLAFAVATSGRTPNTSIAALFIDLDGFKPVNDQAGHDAGDRLLVAIANELLLTLRPTDTVARVGGDEFVVLIDHGQDMEGLDRIAERVTSAIRRDVRLSGATLVVSASVGIACIDLLVEPDAGPDELLRRADVAMYRAKESGGDCHATFERVASSGGQHRVEGRSADAGTG